MARYKVYRNPHNGHTEKVKDGFNWVVLFFGPLWHLFNGLVAQGIGWLLIAFIAGLPTLGIGSIIVWIIAGFKANKQKEKKYLENGWHYIGYEGEENTI
jgi:hypothetical protein